jgi:phospholipid/cholesterol/gamma-HCH transport system substrate-binding protein
MKNDNKKSVIVGIFVLIGIIIFIAGVLTLGGQQKKFVKSIKLSAVFDDVAGLQQGNNVWFSGVKIGTVRKINFYGESQVEIILAVEAKVQEYIRKDSKATIGSDGLIGNKIIVIYGGTTQSPAVEDGDRLTAEMPLDTDKMMSTLQENNKNLVTITENLKVLTTKIAEGKGIVGAVMTDSTLAVSFKNTLRNLESASFESRRTLSELANVSKNLNKEGTLLHQLTNDKETFPKLQNTVSKLEETSNNAEILTKNLSATSQKLNSTDNTAGMLLNDEEFAGKLRSTMTNVDSATLNLNKGLEALPYTWPFRKGFKRKAKAEAAQGN